MTLNLKDTVRARFAPQPKWFVQWPNEPKTMNLLESELDTERTMSYGDANHNRLVIGINKTNNLNKKSSPRSSLRKICSYIYLLDLYKNYNSLLHSDFLLVFFILHPIMEFFSFIFPSLLSSQLSTCRSDY